MLSLVLDVYPAQIEIPTISEVIQVIRGFLKPEENTTENSRLFAATGVLLLVMNSIRRRKRKIRTNQREGECGKVLVTVPKVKMEC